MFPRPLAATMADWAWLRMRTSRTSTPRFSYRFNLERDKESRNAIQAAGPTGPRDHTYLNLGSYYFYGRSVQRLSGATADGVPTVITAREPFYRVGGNMTFNYRCCLQFNALYMYGHDSNLLPIDANGDS